MSDMAGKVVVITGASSGIGAAAGRHLAACGAQVVAGERRTERHAELVSDITRDGSIANARAVDVTSFTDTQALVDFATAEPGRVDVIVNNAGVMPCSRSARATWMGGTR